MVDNTVRRGGGGGTKQGNWAVGGSVNYNDDNVNDDKGGGGYRDDNHNDNSCEDKAGGGCKGTAHPGVGTKYNVLVIMPNANTRSSLMTT